MRLFAARIDFTEVVRQHQGKVFSLAYHFLRDRGAAEEVAQEVFLHLHQKIGELESAAHITFWLRKVTSHRCIDESRRRKHRPRLALDQVPEPASASPQRDPMLSATLQKLVATLPEKPRMVVLLRYQEDLEPTEIAELLGMPVSTVKSHLHRSLVILRGKMERHGTGSLYGVSKI